MNSCLRIVPPSAVALALLAAPLAAWANAPGWIFGIGTGPQRLNVEGDVGFTSARGAERASVDLSPEDISDLMESAIGFQAYAARGPWRFNLSYANLVLEDSSSAVVADQIPLSATFELEIKFGEFTAVRRFADVGPNQFSVLAGVRTTHHDYQVDIASGPGAVRRSLDEDWTDILVGMTHAVPLSGTVFLNTTAAVGFGGTDSYWSARTFIGWQFARSWNLGLFVEYRAIEYENGEPGDSDWYLYDANEWGPGVKIAYIFR